MALTGIQYQSMRLKFRGLLSNPYQFVSETELDSFLGQLFIDATGSVTAAQKTQADTLLAGVLSSPAYAAVPADIATFFTQLIAASPAVIQALVASRYQQIKNQLTGALSIAGIRTEAQMLGYVAGYATINWATLLPGAYQIMVSDQGVTNGTTMVRADQSGNGNDYSATGHNPTVASTLNNRPTLLFNGVNQWMTSAFTAPSPAAAGYDIFAVIRIPVFGVGGRILSDNTDADVLFITSATSFGWFAAGSGPTNAGLAGGIWGVVRGHRVNSAADYVQGGNAAQSAAAGAGTLGTSPNRSIAASAAGNNPANIEVALLAYIPAGLSVTAALVGVDSYYGGLVTHA